MQAEMAVTTEPDAHSHPISAELLFREQARFVASFLRHMGTSESDLDDMLQDVFVLAHRKGGYLPGAAGPRTWLASLAIRVTLARRRARARRPPPVEVPENLPDDAQGPAELLESRRSLRRVQAALEDLSVEHRAAFVLFEIEGESCELVRIRALLDRDPAAARRLAERSQREFPRGILSEERQALAIMALAKTGAKREARDTARSFFARYPHSPMRELIDAALQR